HRTLTPAHLSTRPHSPRTRPPLPRWSFFLTIPRPPTSTLFPYTTLFRSHRREVAVRVRLGHPLLALDRLEAAELADAARRGQVVDRKSTRLNSSHQIISYAVFCLQKKKQEGTTRARQRVETSDETQRLSR